MSDVKHTEERTETHACDSPCDICRHYPPSSTDGKPCSMCPAEPAEPTEQVRAYMSLADCVSRQAAINAINSWFEIAKHPMNRGAYNNGELAAYSTAISEIENLSSAEPERKTGRWLKAYGEHEATGIRPFYRYCSRCNEATAFPFKYCPNCGARMDGE